MATLFPRVDVIKKSMLAFRTLTLILVQLKVYSNAMQFDEGCYIEEPSILQVAFVMDNTGTFFGGGSNSFFAQFAALAPTLMQEIDKDYPGTQFALTIHADWIWKALPAFGSKLTNDEESCYKRWIEFTTDRRHFQNRMRRVPELPNGAEENGLSALAFTAADTKLGWIRNATTSEGKKVRRVMVLVTDQDEGHPLKNPGYRHEFKGDGTDTCRTSKHPDKKKMSEVFQKYEMSIVALLYVNSVQPILDQKYDTHFKEIGVSIPYCGRKFAAKSKSKGILLADLIGNLHIPKDFWLDDDDVESEEESPSNSSMSLGEIVLQRESEIQDVLPKVKAGKYDYLIKFVKDCLRETSGCLFGDPEGFNTLGF